MEPKVKIRIQGVTLPGDLGDGYGGYISRGALHVCVPPGKLLFEIPADKHRELIRLASTEGLQLCYFKG